LKAVLSADDKGWVETRLPVPGRNFIANYEPIQCDCHTKTDGKPVRLFRKFEFNGRPKVLAIDGQTLRVRCLDPVRVQCDPADSIEMSRSRYQKALEVSDRFMGRADNNGVTHALSEGPAGVYLTADLCPSRRHRLESGFFNQLGLIHSRTGTAVPIGLSVTGLWLSAHEKEFEFLKDLETKGVLRITWINHTYHHPYRSRFSGYKNKLLIGKAYPDEEVLDLEVALLQQGEMPSPYFRFPGLVSAPDWLKKIKDLSLITLGSDSWLAKGEEPRSGSVILVHANGNEPKGIKIFESWLPYLRKLGPFLNLSDLFPRYSSARS